MEGAIGSRLFEAFDRGIHRLSGSSEGARGQHLDSLCVSYFGARLDNFLMGFLELLSEMSELRHFSFDEGISQLLYRAIDESVVRLSGFEDPLSKGVEGRLCSLAGSCA